VRCFFLNLNQITARFTKFLSSIYNRSTIAAKAPIRDLCPLDIALITETHFTKYFNVFIPIYTLFKSNHLDNTAHGGVAIIIKSTLSFSLLPNFSLDYLQSCAVSIKLNNIPITIAAIYCPPRHHNISSISLTFHNRWRN